jgi:hypothetical protein
MDAELIHFGVSELDERALCSHVVDTPESECPLCVYTIDGSISQADESLADLERKTVFQQAYCLWNSLHNNMNCYVLARQIAERMKADFIETTGGELEPWMQRINCETVFAHFVYHDRQKSSLTVLIDQEIGNAGALVRVTERATLVVKKRRLEEVNDGCSALEAARGVDVEVDAAGLRNHVLASENYRQWIKLRLHALKYT